jgi:hypothetical protein
MNLSERFHKVTDMDPFSRNLGWLLFVVGAEEAAAFLVSWQQNFKFSLTIVSL